MFHEDPYRGESKNDQSRLEFCRSDHGDDLMVVFGEEFLKGWQLFDILKIHGQGPRRT